MEFSEDTDTEVVIMPESELVPEETVVTVQDGSVTSVEVGAETYSITYDENGKVDGVTVVSGDTTTTTRRTQQADFVSDRRLQSCENSCEASANQICGALIYACNDTSSPVFLLLGPLCDDLSGLCDTSGIVQGCARQCAPCECSRPNLDVILLHPFLAGTTNSLRGRLPKFDMGLICSRSRAPA